MRPDTEAGQEQQDGVIPAVYLPTADKYRRLTSRLSQEQKGLGERALIASQQPSEPW